MKDTMQSRVKRLLTVLLFVCCCQVSLAAVPKTVMVVLGSADPKVLADRIEVASRLYKTQPVDKIIVSGGCGAHGSSICEATAMFEGLVKRGVEPSKIYKEENAKTTVQNYVFSRILRDEQGQRIIQPGDTVWVVSNHWHAISVAARFKKHDQVAAKFYVEGDIDPKESDKLDYVGIFTGESDNATFVRKARWMTPDMVWSENKQIHYLMDDVVYSTDADNEQTQKIAIGEVFKGLEQLDARAQRSFIDTEKFWWVRSGENLFSIDKKSKKVVFDQLWSTAIAKLPEAWKTGAFNTGVVIGKKLFLFANERVLLAEKKGKNFEFVKEGPAADFIAEWPYAWGKSNVSAAYIDAETQELRLYRNLEVLRLTKDLQVIEKASRLKLKWIN